MGNKWYATLPDYECYYCAGPTETIWETICDDCWCILLEGIFSYRLKAKEILNGRY